jgi:DNA-binding TFAR19-related protein (PDSD5 family)
MNELEALRQQRMQQMQQQAQEQAQVEQQVAQAEALVKQRMTKAAIERYSTLKSAHPEKAVQVLVVLAQMIQSGQVGVVDDKHLKLLLTKMQPEKKEFKITRK